MKLKKHAIIWTIIILSLLVIAARPDFQAAQVKNPVTGDAKNTVTIPGHAVEKAPGLYYLGTTIDEGRIVEGYAIIKYKDRNVKPQTECGNGICEPGENAKKCAADCGGGTIPDPDASSCYGFLARGAKWKGIEPYLVNPQNNQGLDEAEVSLNFAYDIDKWEQAAGTNIIGTGSTTTQILIADTESTDGQNEVYFGTINESGAIAITIVWGIFGGPPKGRELVEWDQVYDQTDYSWSLTGENSSMDFESIATHELGHTAGLDDLYTSDCAQQTMYGYASEGETNKRSLESGDITGIQKLY